MSLVSVTALGDIASLAVDNAGFAAARGAVEVDLDLTVLGQMALFILLMLVLKPLLFDPMLRLFEEREKRISGAKLQARKMDEESAGALTKYEASMAKARAEANAERDRLRAEGVKVESDILTRVRAEAAKSLEEGRKLLADQRLAIETHVEGEARGIAREIAATTLGREVHDVREVRGL